MSDLLDPSVDPSERLSPAALLSARGAARDAALLVCSHSADSDEARGVLVQLGLVPPGPTATLRAPRRTLRRSGDVMSVRGAAAAFGVDMGTVVALVRTGQIAQTVARGTHVRVVIPEGGLPTLAFEDELLTVRAAAAEVGATIDRIYRLIDTGCLTPVSLAHVRTVFRAQLVEHFSRSPTNT